MNTPRPSHTNTPAAAAAAAAAAIFAVLPLLWNGLVGAAAGAATNGLVDWAVGEKHRVTKQVQECENRTTMCCWCPLSLISPAPTFITWDKLSPVGDFFNPSVFQQNWSWQYSCFERSRKWKNLMFHPHSLITTATCSLHLNQESPQDPTRVQKL